MESGEKTRKMFRRAQNCMASGVTSNYRFWGDDKSLVLKEGKGAYVWDQDDSKYLDYRLGFGPVILGHGFPSVIEKVTQALTMGNVFAMTHEYEIEAAERIKKLTGVDLIRYATSGTEATMHAIRIARAFTGRDKIIKFEGTYHGLHDYVLWGNWPPFEAAGFRNSPVPITQGSGIPRAIGDLVILVPFNDEALLEQKVKANWGDVACILVEPVMGNCASIMPKDGYLEFIRDLCDQHGIVLIFDEVKTGFRIAKGGAQEFFNVKADLVTYAKALGNGFPIAAIGGKKDMMEGLLYSNILQGGTYAGNAVATAAACATLDEIEMGALDFVKAHGRKLKAGINKILQERGIPGFVQGPSAMPAVVLSEKEAIYEFRDMAAADTASYKNIIWELLKKGVMPDTGVHEPWFISASHTDGDAEFALEAFDEALKEVFG